MKLPYSEGSVFVLPLEGGGYARGVVARATKKGRVLFGYFFGPRLRSEDQASFDELVAHKAIMCLRFGDLGLINGEWPVLGALPGWDRNAWPMPRFVNRGIAGHGKSYLVEYSDTDPNLEIGRWIIDDNPELPANSLSGYGAVSIKLDKALQSPQPSVSA